jgi:hypothetical protein
MTAIATRRSSRTPSRSREPATNQIELHVPTSRKNNTDGASPNQR